MKRIATAVLQRQQPRPRQCVVEVVALDDEQSHLVNIRQGDLRDGVLQSTQESTLTAKPCTLDDAQRRAQRFIEQRLQSGDQLVRQTGFAGLDRLQTATPRPAGPSPAPTAVSPWMQALLKRCQPDAWKLLARGRQARLAWRVAEAAGGLPSADQDALRALVPRFVSHLGQGDDLLDLCLASAIGRLGDPGAADAMAELARRSTHAATRRYAHQAWLMLQTPSERLRHSQAWLESWREALDTGSTHTLLARAQALVDGKAGAAAEGWPELLTHWYSASWSDAAARQQLLALLKVLPLQPGPFQALRHLYKAAEQWRDAETLAVLHGRFERGPAYFNARGYAVGYRFQDPATGRWVQTSVHDELTSPHPRLAFTNKTRDYLRLRGWRNLRRLAALGHPHAPELAVQLLLALDHAPLPALRDLQRYAYVQGRYQSVTLHQAPESGWLIVSKLLLAQMPGLRVSARANRWWATEPMPSGSAPARWEALQPMWDAHPQALLTLALRSCNALVQRVAARALQDHRPWLAQQAEADIATLLESPFEGSAALGLEVVRARLQAGVGLADEVRWLHRLIRSQSAAAQAFAQERIAANPSGLAQQPGLVAALLLCPHPPLHLQGQGLLPLAEPQAVVAELLLALQGIDPEEPGLRATTQRLEHLLSHALQAAAAQAAVEPLLCLLHHPSTAVMALGAAWLLLHPHGMTLLPAGLLGQLLGDADPERRAVGVKLLSGLDDELLQSQSGLLLELAVQPHPAIRLAIEPVLQRLCEGADAGQVFAADLAQRFYQVLFAADPSADLIDSAGTSASPETLHDMALRWLTGPLQAQAPARDADGAWRALQARARGAQRYGEWLLGALPHAAFSLRQLATLARHTTAAVRHWAWASIDQTLPAAPTPEQAEQLLPLADCTFDDSLARAQALMGETLPDASLPVELLIAWIDHPRPWVQALGRQRLVRRMQAHEAALCLTRLSQHPSTAVQLFVTHWLLEMPREPVDAFAQRLRELTPYFLTVLSQVHRGRAAKTRLLDFLRSATDHAAPAAVVAELFGRQVVTSSLTDKPQYIAGLRDIAARHPQLAMPYLQSASTA